MRVGIVGVGFMGRMHANVYSAMDDVSLMAAVGNHPDQLDAYCREFDAKPYETLDAMLATEDLDAVDICLPTFLHKDFTVRALQAGKHVFCEKPMALTLGEADEMIAAAAAAGKVLMIGHCIRFWPEYAKLRSLKESGELGKLLSVNLTRFAEFPSWSTDNWLAYEEKAGGGVLDMHIHDTDFAHYLLGTPQEMVSYGTVDHRGPGHVFTTMRFLDGAIAHLEGGWNLPTKTPFKHSFRAVFDNGAAIMDAGPMTIYENGKDPVIVDFPKMAAAGGGNISDLGGYFHELRYFADCIASNKTPSIVTPESSRQSLSTVLEEIRQIKSKAIAS